ncbi:hypothetical protein OI911_34465 [Pseudomonas aeruginosa]|nr:hypothetical protein OI911_34465 [Pseudomonas aeruginosa]
MDQVLYDKAERTLGAPAPIDEVGCTAGPVRQRAWEAFVDRAASPQGQTMSIGVLDRPMSPTPSPRAPNCALA